MLTSSLLVAVILVMAMILGSNSGKKLAEVEIVNKNTANIVVGLDYFFQDQDRYPNAVEYADTSVMLNYFNTFPPVSYTSDKCSESYVYKRVSSKQFSLDYCLIQDYKGKNEGWNRYVSNAKD